jgi:hypothetical protein
LANHRLPTRSQDILCIGTGNPAQFPNIPRDRKTREKIMKATQMKKSVLNSRNVALLVAAGLIAGTGTAIAEESATPTPTSKPATQYQIARDAYKTALEAYIANRKSSQEQYKAALATFQTAHKSYVDARKPILATFKADLTAAKTARDTALAAATTSEAKLAAQNAHKSAVAAATAKRDTAIAALGAAPVAPAKPNLGAKPTPPVKPTPKASKSQ